MLATSEKVNQFIRDVRSCDYCCRVIMEFNLKLEEVAYHLQGVSSPYAKEVIYENASDPYSDANKIALMEEEAKLLRERQRFVDRIMECEKIEAIESMEDKNLIIDLYVNKTRYVDLEEKYCYGKSGIFKRAHRILGDLFKVETFSPKKCDTMIV